MTKDTKNGSKLYFKILNVEKLGIDSHYLNSIPIFEDFISHSQWPNPNLVPRAFPFLSLGRREKALAPGGLLCILIGQ
jgi:hypothetical protein